MRETILTIVGNVVDEPQRRVLDTGTSMLTFRVASTERRFDRNAGAWVDGDSLFARVTCWRQLADNAYLSLRKGDPVVLTGRLFTRPYEVDGQRRSMQEIEVSAVGHDLSRGVGQFRRGSRLDLAAIAEPAAPPTQQQPVRVEQTDQPAPIAEPARTAEVA